MFVVLLLGIIVIAELKALFSDFEKN